jgi:outer membrane lipoprotein-sorting protein
VRHIVAARELPFREKRRKILGLDLFSPIPHTSVATMSMMSSALLPALLASMSWQAQVATGQTAAAPAKVIVNAPKAGPAPARPALSAPVAVVRAKAPAPQAGPALSAADRTAVIDKVSAALTRVKTAQGRFTQSDPADPRANASGKFYISRPGKVRFEYDTPEPMFIVSDGVSLSIEEPKRKSFDAIPLKSHPLNLFLRSNIDLKRNGNVKDVTAAGGSWFVTLVDTSGEAEGRMILEFRQSDFELLGWRVVDGAGAETRTRLTGVQTNVSVKPALFVVKDPADRRDNRR